jgi:branched-chain amino acid transport system permease protein
MHSFGHAAYFGLGAYGAALLVKWFAACRWGSRWQRRPLVAGRRAAVRLVRVRLSGVYLAMLTLAFAQIVWAVVFQWDSSPAAPTACSGSGRRRLRQAWSILFPDTRAAAARRVAARKFCSRHSVTRCGQGVTRCLARRSDRSSTSSACSGWPSPSPARSAGLAGGLYAFSKGSDLAGDHRRRPSVDGLVMVLLGGIQTLTGPMVGASVFGAAGLS